MARAQLEILHRLRTGIVLRRLLGLLTAAVLVAGCGGGAPGGTGGSGTSAPLALALQLVDSSGVSVTQLAAGQTARAEAVLKRNGTPVANEIVSFSVGGGFASISPTSGAVLTDASGLARVSVTASDTLAGATTLSASTSVSGQSASASTNFSVGLTGTGNLKISALAVSVGTSGLSAYGTASIAVSVVDSNGAAPAKPVTVTFSTSCPAGKATITSSASTLPNGTVQATFTDAGCAQTAPIDATITAAIPSDTKAQTFQINPPSSGSFRFVSANPSDRSITLKGQGGNGRQEFATLTFRLVDVAGNGVADSDVCFDATTYVGGLNVDGFNDVNLPVTPGAVALCGSDNTLRYVKRTGVDGVVTVQVNSGTTPTPVRVRARTLYPTTSSTRLETVSDSLSISTGLPLQRSFDLSLTSSNVEGRDISGTKVTFTARLADQFGNPVPDGTVVNFITSGGAICTSATGSCSTSNGVCTCDWLSQDPRPADGRAVVLAFTVGLEDYVDANGNNVYDAGEPFADMGDAYLDANKDGSYTLGADTCLRYQNPNQCSTSGDGLRGTAHLRKSAVVLMSGSNTPTVIIPAAYNAGGFVRVASTNCPTGSPVIPLIVAFDLEDGVGNAMPAKSGVAAVVQTSIVSAAIDPSAVPNLVLGLDPTRDSQNAPKSATGLSDPTLIGTIHSLTLTPVASTGAASCVTGSGNVQIKVTTPSGLSTFARILFEGEPRTTSRFAVPVQVQ